MKNEAMFTSNNLNWCTPIEFFNELNNEFNFNLDAAATDKSAKCENYFTPETDGLNQTWGGYNVFLNPPYGRHIGDWVKKAYEEGQKPNTTVVLLIPARTDTRYFHDYIYGKAEIRFIKGRLKFTDEDGNTKDAAPFPSMVAIFRGPKETNGQNGAKEPITNVLKDKELTANELTEHLKTMGYDYERGTVSPCLTKLKAAGIIKTTGKRPCEITGKNAVTYTAI